MKRSKRLWVLAAACALVASLLTAASAFAAKPSIDETYTSGLTAESVVLNVEINSGGVETTYHFEYGTTTGYGSSVPVPEGVVGAGSQALVVSVQVSGLSANTLYHYRVVAKNAGGETVGADRTFVFQLAAPSGEGCTNASLRTGYAARLPDCRAYELVSPPEVEPWFETSTNATTMGNLVGRGIRAKGETFGSQASLSGDRVLFFSPFGFPGKSDGSFFLASRGPGGWLTEDPVPPQSVTNSGVGCPNAYFPLLTPEFTNWVLADGYGQGERQEGFEAIKQKDCATDEPALVEGEPQGLQNLFLHVPGAGIEAGSYRLMDTPQRAPEGASLNDAWAQGASDDLSRIVFTESALLTLTPEAPAITPAVNDLHAGPSEDLYMWSGGVVSLVTILPGGTPVAGTLANGDVPHDVGTASGVGSATFTHAISNDAERVAFEAQGNLYVRENPQQQAEGECATPAQACTVRLDTSEGGAASGGGHFQWASSDGARVFFTDERALVAGAHASAGRPDLYEYDFEAPEGKRLTDVTEGSEGADVLGVSGASEDGSVVYFVAEAALTGTQANSQGATAQPGQPNLYVRKEVEQRGEKRPVTMFIATLGAGDSDDWESPPEWITAQVSQDGGFIAFDSLDQLTGYDNHGPCVGSRLPFETGPCQEIFLYDAGRGVLECASCAPSGELPGGPARIGPPIKTDATMNEYTNGYLQRFVSDGGHVFFNTVARLLPGDTNGLSNVYEYENGELHLLSPGSTSANAYFAEASANGENVFLLTSELLGDMNGDISLFDARVGGGFPEPTEAQACGEGDCAPPAAPPTFSTPASATLTGAGNLTPPLAKQEVKGVKVAVKPLTRTQKLARALAACRRAHPHARRKRLACEAHARKQYGPISKATNAAKAGRKGTR